MMYKTRTSTITNSKNSKNGEQFEIPTRLESRSNAPIFQRTNLQNNGIEKTSCDYFCFSCPKNHSEIWLTLNTVITRKQLEFDNKTQVLSELKFRMLCAFHTHKNETLSREFLLRYVWRSKEKDLNNVNVMISELRTLIKDPELEIVTIRNEGYMMINKTKETR